MKILLKNATIIDPKGAFHLQQVDLYICNGIIEEIGPNLSIEADRSLKKIIYMSLWVGSTPVFALVNPALKNVKP